MARWHFIRTYKRLLHERPFVTNVFTTCTFMTAGDLVSQTIVQSHKEYDLKQTARFATAGLLFVGPVVRSCLVAIDKIFGPTSSMLVLGKKLFFDQICIAPLFLAANITVLTLLRTHSFEQVKPELARNYMGLLRLNYTFWPIVQLMNFYFIPLTYRVLFGSTAALIWNTLFSYRLYNRRLIQDHYDELIEEIEGVYRHP